MEEKPQNLCDYLLAHGYISRKQYEEARFTRLVEGGDYESLFRKMGVDIRVLYEAKKRLGDYNLGDYMIEKGYASPEQLEEARKGQQSTGGDLANILIDLGLNPRDVYEAKAAELQQPFVDLTVYRPDQSALDAVPGHIVRRHNALPIKRDGITLYVAIADTNDMAAVEDLRLASRCPISCCQIRLVLAVPEHIEEAIRKYYGEGTNDTPPEDSSNSPTD